MSHCILESILICFILFIFLAGGLYGETEAWWRQNLVHWVQETINLFVVIQLVQGKKHQFPFDPQSEVLLGWVNIPMSLCCMPWKSQVGVVFYIYASHLMGAIVWGLSFSQSQPDLRVFSLDTPVFLPLQNRLPVKNILPALFGGSLRSLSCAFSQSRLTYALQCCR